MARVLTIILLALCANVLPGIATLFGGAQPLKAEELRELIRQNRELLEQVQRQQAQIDELRELVSELTNADAQQERRIEEMREEVAEPALVIPRIKIDSERELHISGEAGLAYFDGGPKSSIPSGSFRADDVKVYLEAPVWRDTYFFAELDLVTREANDEFFHMGEIYVDFENVSGRLGGPDALINLRIGRFDIPFGEEYQHRGVMDNPLVTHSLSDIWGIDEGIEFYGNAGRFSYVAAVQNGGHKTLEDFDSDKAFIVRAGYAPSNRLQLSASAMRTGDLNVAGDGLSEVWFGGGFFRALGPAATTTTFHANLYELDATLNWNGGSLRAAGGTARFDDNDTVSDNRRELDYFFVESVQRIAGRLRGAVRYSRIDTDKGYPLVGHGDFGNYLFRSAPTDYLWRLSLGFGYRVADPVLFKFEYSIENGRLINGELRDDEDLFSAELGLKF